MIIKLRYIEIGKITQQGGIFCYKTMGVEEVRDQFNYLHFTVKVVNKQKFLLFTLKYGILYTVDEGEDKIERYL